MVKKIATFLLFCAFAVTCGCYQYQPQYVSSAEYSANYRDNLRKSIEYALKTNPQPAPLPKNWQSMVKDSISTRLKDPYSAKFRFLEQPEPYAFSNADRYPSEYHSAEYPMFGLVGGVFVNAKNSYGGYTGEKLWIYIISNGAVGYLATNNIVRWETTSEAINHINGYEVFIKR